MDQHTDRPGGTGTQYIGTMPTNYEPYLQAAGTIERQLVDRVREGNGKAAIVGSRSEAEERVRAVNQRFARHRLPGRLVVRGDSIDFERPTLNGK